MSRHQRESRTRDVACESCAVRAIERLGTWRLCDDEIEIVHAEWPRTSRLEAGVDEQLHHVLDFDSAMTVKVCQQATPLCATEIDRYHATGGLENPLDLPRALLPSLPREMVKHQRAEDDVESSIKKRQVLGDRNLKRGKCTGLLRLSSRASNHRR